MSKLYDIVDPNLRLETTYQPSNGFLFSELYKDQTIVVKFLRRFGCCLCRTEALELSKQMRELEKLNVKLIAVGFDRKGLTSFMKGNYWHGEIYLDTKKSIYQYFGFEKVPVLKSLKKLFRKSTRKAIKQSNKETPGNFRGDGFQMGGTVIINEQGQLIYKYSQQEFEEYPTIEEIIRVLNKNNPKDINSIPRPLPIIFKDSEPVLRHITSNESDLEDSIHTPELNEFNTIQSNIHALDEDPNAKINLDSMNMRLNQDCCDGHSMEY